MPLTTYTPSASDATRLSFAGVPFDETAPSSHDNLSVSAKFFLKPIQDEVLALWASSLAGAPALTVHNSTGSTITKGKLVAISGWDSGSALPTVNLAVSDDFRYPPSYVVTADIANGASGNVSQFATISGLDTSAYSIGAEVYLASSSAPGTFTAPPNVSFKVYAVGRVVTVNATTGSVFFFPGLCVDQSVTPSGFQVINNTGSSIPAGPIAITSWIESSTAFRCTLASGVRADAFIGSALANGASTVAYLVKTFGSSLDTTFSTLGDPVYLKADGTLSLSATRQRIGSVKTLANPGNVKGKIYEPTPHRGNSSGAPSDPVAGDTYYDTGTTKVYIYANSSWIALT